VTLPRLIPFDRGVNVMASVHMAEGWMVPPFAHVVAPAKAKFPLSEIVLIFKGVVPEFVSVTILGWLVEFVF